MTKLKKMHNLISVSSKLQGEFKDKRAYSVDPDEAAHFELPHLDLHCLQIHLLPFHFDAF